MSYAPTLPETPAVHALQQAAEEAASQIAETSHDNSIGISRRALIDLIEKLSWQARAGLGVLALAIVFLSVISLTMVLSTQIVAPAGLGTRLVLWVGLVSLSGYVCMSHLWRYRKGISFGSRPFSWRAHYTARLSVFSAAIGSGALMLTPNGLSPTVQGAMIMMVGIVGLVGAALHTAHRPTLFAASLPALFFSFYAVTQRFDVLAGGNVTGVFAGIACAGLILGLINMRATSLIMQSYHIWPRQVTQPLTAAQRAKRRAYNPYIQADKNLPEKASA